MNQNLDEVVESIKSWLSLPNNTRWLMIYDNYNNPKLPSNTDAIVIDIRKFLPELYQGLIIIITRSLEVRISRSIQIQKLGNLRNSLEILLNVLRREGLVFSKDVLDLILLL